MPTQEGTSAGTGVTELLKAWSAGNQQALERLTPRVHRELKRIAHRYMNAEGAGHTLQTTALVNEAYLRLVDAREVSWQDRAHFLAVAAQMMRHILVDYARAKGRRKRGGEMQRVTLEEGLEISPDKLDSFEALDQALTRLAEAEPRKGRVVELRFFGGLSMKETAEVLQVSTETVKLDWRFAKAWLHRELRRGDGRSASA
jgi:RNA polymerase sigma factor (TIGR02999 family)